ncbi:tetratricopeptide repeat protein, partial [Streptomyces sp. SID2955]|nr:tetratricopeptide repeat protein [Streptomyces sp. SID2955]
LYRSGAAAAPPVALAEALTVKARSQRWTADFDAALVTLDSAQSVLHEAPEGHGRSLAAADILGERGRLLVHRGDAAEALELQQRRIAVLTALGDAGGPAVLERLADAESELARSLHGLGRFRDAVDAMSDATAEALDRRAGEHPDTLGDEALGAMVTRANRLRLMDRFEEALAVLREALPFVDRPENSATPTGAANLAVVLNNLGGTLMCLERYEEAVEPIRRGLAIRRALAADAGGPVEPLAGSLLQYADALQELGRDDEARAAAEECVAVSTDLVSRGLLDPRTKARAQAMLAEILLNTAETAARGQRRGDIRRAVRLLHASLRFYERNKAAMPGDHLAEYASMLHVTTYHLSRLTVSRLTLFALAHRMLDAWRTATRHDPAQHGDDLVEALTSVAVAYERTGRPARAERLLAEAVAVRRMLVERRGQGTDPALLASALARHAGRLSLDGRADAALPLLREALVQTDRARPYLSPEEYALNVAVCHHNLADTLPWTGALHEALEEVAAAEACLGAVAARLPDRYAEEMRDCAELRGRITDAMTNGLPARPGRRRPRRR